MNLTKKLAALVLAMMMALSVMAMPAAAYGGDSGVMPLGGVRTCPECGRSVSAYTHTEETDRWTVSSCSRKTYAHDHADLTTYDDYNCSCGRYLGTVEVSTRTNVCQG